MNGIIFSVQRTDDGDLKVLYGPDNTFIGTFSDNVTGHLTRLIFNMATVDRLLKEAR